MSLRFPRVLALCLALVAPFASAEEFKLALSAAPTAMDPQFHDASANNNVSSHIFSTLIDIDSENRLVPALALSWKMIDPLTWEFKLRRNVKFHDGSVLTAQDVAWSLARPATILDSPASYSFYTKVISATRIVDPVTIRLSTPTPFPNLPTNLSGVFILSKQAAQAVKSADFNRGKGMVGTGPFKFVRFLRDDRVELARHDAYWGPKPAWSTVTLRFIPSSATRIAALLAGDVQAIENVPSQDLARLRSNPDLHIASHLSARLISLAPDTKRAITPFITARDGKPLTRNPLQDLRVRQALSLAINRALIRERITGGLTEPTGNLLPAFAEGYESTLAVPRQDVDGAKKLLAQAGYPDGFAMTLHVPNDRFPDGEKTAIAIAQMWARIGVATKVEGVPFSVFATRSSSHAYSMSLSGYATNGDLSLMVAGLLACEDEANGHGASNVQQYCNPKLDALLTRAEATLDDKARLALLRQAEVVGINDLGLIPVHHLVTTWASRKGTAYLGRADEATFAHYFTRQ